MVIWWVVGMSPDGRSPHFTLYFSTVQQPHSVVQPIQFCFSSLAPLALWCGMLATVWAAEDKLLQADLAKLADPATRDAEVARLAGCDGKKQTLLNYRFHPCPQRGNAAPILLLSARYKLDFGPRPGGREEYPVERPDEVFGSQVVEPVALLEPSPMPIKDQVLLLFDSTGREIRPFGGNNFINQGYVFDFNGDGVLERADATSYGIAEAKDQQIDVFELATVEAKPQVLLQVIYNWHPRSAPASNDWGFTCFDENNDGVLEIGFGPKGVFSGNPKPAFVFRRDAAGNYGCGKLPPQAHLRVMQSGETLKGIAKTDKGLGYPVLDENTPVGTAPPDPAARYEFKSLKGASDTELLAFFHGRPRHDPFMGPEDAVSDHPPAGFWEMAPKQAALALADANRTPSHRGGWKLAVDDRGGITPPQSGWLVYRSNPDNSYSYNPRVFALRFGVPKPVLVVTEYNSSGMVGSNRLADAPAHGFRVIDLTEAEAAFVAGTLFWLDRVRSLSVAAWENRGGWSSSADGYGALLLMPDGAPSRLLAEGTVWACDSMSARWYEDYTREVAVNLAEYLLCNLWVSHLGERWKVGPELDRQGTMTPLKDRLAPRTSAVARQQLLATMAGLFARHREDPLPSQVVARLVQAAGDDGFAEFIPDLERLQQALPPSDAEDLEYEKLDRRFERDHFGTPLRDDPSDHPKDYARYKELGERQALKPGPILREQLKRALGQLRIMGDPAALKRLALSNERTGPWALKQLQSKDPAAWADVVTAGWKMAKVEERRQIFATLAVGDPPAARRFLDQLPAKEASPILLEAADFLRESDAEAAARRIPELLSFIASRKNEVDRRGWAMRLVVQLKLDDTQRQKLTDLLVAEIKHPQQTQFQSETTVTDAVRALGALPDAARHLPLFKSLKSDDPWGEGAVCGILVRLAKDEQERKQIMESFARPCFKNPPGMMNHLFLRALARDLRGVAPEIAAFATQSPAVPDGAKADSSGGKDQDLTVERYHCAREITALWLEPDAFTRTRMWLALAINRSTWFANRDGDALRARAAADIRQTPLAERQAAIAGMLAAVPGDTHINGETSAWLKQLAED